MNTSDKMVSVVRDVNALVDQYGLAEVVHALGFITNFPKKTTVTFYDADGNTWDISVHDVSRLMNEYAGGRGFIQAIKTFREITGCGLKEAKSAIEQYFNHKPYQY